MYGPRAIIGPPFDFAGIDHMTLRAHLAASAGLCLVLAMSGTAAASGIGADAAVSAVSATQPQSAQNGAIVLYPEGFFDQFSPVTARDMIARLPGFSLSGGQQDRRGLADAFGNLLIDGRRPSNKSMDLGTVLERIPAGDVARIEIIREALPDYEMRGHGQLANIILKEGAGRSANWRLSAQHFSGSNRITPNGEIFYSRPIGAMELTAGLQFTVRAPREKNDERILAPDRTLTELRHDEDQRRFWEISPSLSVASPVGESGRLRLDASAAHWNWNRDMFTGIQTVTASGAVQPGGAERSETTNFGNRGSATLTYSHDVSDELELESVAYIQHHDFEDGPQRFEEFGAAGNLTDTTILIFEGEQGERALRQSASWTPSSRHAFDLSAEGAFNYRDTTLDLLKDDGVTIAPVPLPVSDTRVEELRGELGATHVWSLSSAHSLESGLRYEVSEISQTGDAEQTRSFNFIKPSMALVWTPDRQTRWRISGNRDVDQLQFNKFASSVSLTDDTSTLGNPDYAPQNTWSVGAEWERRFGEDASVSITLRRDWVKDLDDFIPVVTDQGVFDAPGNIGDGDAYLARLEWSSPLELLGLSNAVLDGSVEYYDTEVTDPLTGETRPFSDVALWETRLDFRQTFPRAGFAWGWDYYWRDNQQVFRARELRLQDPPDGDLDLYVETTRFAGLTARLGADFVFNSPSYRERIIFDGSRADGLIDRIEQRDEYDGTTLYLQVRGTL